MPKYKSFIFPECYCGEVTGHYIAFFLEIPALGRVYKAGFHSLIKGGSSVNRPSIHSFSFPNNKSAFFQPQCQVLAHTMQYGNACCNDFAVQGSSGRLLPKTVNRLEVPSSPSSTQHNEREKSEGARVHHAEAIYTQTVAHMRHDDTSR